MAGPSDVSRLDTITAFSEPFAFVAVANLPPAKARTGTTVSMRWHTGSE